MLESPIGLAPGARDFNLVQRRTRNIDRPCSFRPRDRPYSREGVRGLVFFEKRRGAAGLTGPLVHSAVNNSIQTTLGLSPQVKSGQVGTKDRISSTRAESVIGLHNSKLLAKSPEVMLQRCCSGKGGGEEIK